MFPRGFADLAHGLLHLLYPNACLVCDAPEAADRPFRHGLCWDCQRSVTTDATATCPRCASTVGPHTDVSDGCPACRARGFAFAGAVRLGPYEGRLREAILRTKFSAGEALAEMLGRVLADERAAFFKGAGIEVVVPVP